MAHTLLFTLGYNAPEDRILPEGYDWSKREPLDEALKTMTHALRPWTIDFHVAQNDATVKGSGSHDKTGRHCLPNDPNGKLDIARHAGSWLRDDNGNVTKALRAHLLGRLHVPQRDDDAAADLERRAGRDDRGARRPRMGLTGRRRSAHHDEREEHDDHDENNGGLASCSSCSSCPS